MTGVSGRLFRVARSAARPAGSALCDHLQHEWAVAPANESSAGGVALAALRWTAPVAAATASGREVLPEGADAGAGEPFLGASGRVRVTPAPDGP